MHFHVQISRCVCKRWMEKQPVTRFQLSSLQKKKKKKKKNQRHWSQRLPMNLRNELDTSHRSTSRRCWFRSTRSNRHTTGSRHINMSGPAERLEALASTCAQTNVHITTFYTAVTSDNDILGDRRIAFWPCSWGTLSGSAFRVTQVERKGDS